MVGSGDPEMVKAVIDNNPDMFDEEEGEEEDEEEDELSLSSALRQLVMGVPLNPDEAHQYGYALQELCDYAGEMLDSDLWSGVRWSAVEQCGLEDLLTKTGPPVDIPLNEGDFPAIGHIPRDQLANYLQAAKGRAEQAPDGEIQQLLEEYTSWLESAADRNLDVVFFYY